MKIAELSAHWVKIPLVTPFRTSFGTSYDRDTFLIRLVTEEGAVGWAECASEPDPLYSSEFLEGDLIVIRDQLVPRLMALGDELCSTRVQSALEPVKGHPMAKHVLETALLDAELKLAGMSFGRYLGAVKDRVPSGVSVGIYDSLDEMMGHVEDYVSQGYLRIKLKIEPGWDLEPVRMVREKYGDDLLLQVDANTAYTLADARHLARLDPFDLLLMEQPLPEDDLRGHAELRLIRLCKEDEGIGICAGLSYTDRRAVLLMQSTGLLDSINAVRCVVSGSLRTKQRPARKTTSSTKRTKITVRSCFTTSPTLMRPFALP